MSTLSPSPSDLSQAIISKCAEDPMWIKSDEALTAIEAYLKAAERRMAIRPLSANLLTAYFNVLDLVMKFDFGDAKPPVCKQAPQVTFSSKGWGYFLGRRAGEPRVEEGEGEGGRVVRGRLQI